MNDPAEFKIKNYNPKKLSKLPLMQWWEQLLIRFFLFETLEPIIQSPDDVMQKIENYESVEAIAPGKRKSKYEVTISDEGDITISDALFSEDQKNNLRDKIIEKGRVNFKEFNKQIASQWPRTSVLLNLYAKVTRFRPHELHGIIEVNGSNLDILDAVLSRALERQTISIPLLATKSQLLQALDSYLGKKCKPHPLPRTNNKEIWAKNFLLAYLDYCLFCQKHSCSPRDNEFVEFVKEKFLEAVDFGRDSLRTTKAWKKKVLDEKFLTRLLADAILEE